MNATPSQQPALEAVDYDPFAQSPAFARAVPSTEAQREIWLACQLGEQASLAYNEAVSLRLHGELDQAAFRAALHSLVARHDALRACFSDDGQQMLVAEHVGIELPVHDLGALDGAQLEAAVQSHMRADIDRPFDLARGPLLRMQLLALGPQRWLLVLTAHHIVCDGWSFGVLLQDLAALYALESRQPAKLRDPVSFADFALALAERELGPEHALDERFWLERFGDLPPPLDLPSDHARPPRRGFASGRIDHELPTPLVERLRALGATQGASLFSVLLGGFAALLQRLAACDEVVVGVPAAGQTLEGFGNCVGHAVNLLPLRLAPDPRAPLAQALPEVQSRMLDAYEHQHYTFGTLLKRLLVPRDPSRVPLAQVMFNLDSELPVSGFPGLRAEAASVPRNFENFELFVNAVPHDGGLRLECQYAAGLFDAATVRRWLECLELLLDQSCARPAAALRELDLLSPRDRAELQRLNATTEALQGPGLLHEWLHQRSAADGARVVFEAGEASLDHEALWGRAWRIAHALRARGVGRGQFVGVCLERGKDLLAAVLGVLASGAAYVPLDPGFPEARLADMAGDAGLSLLLTESACAGALPWERSRSLWLDADAAEIAASPGGAPDPDPARDAEAESPAYMIYTSGSTGRPKGVMLPHRAVVHFLDAVARRPGLRAGERLLAVTTLSFDIAVLELLLPLATGGCVVLATKQQSADGFALRALLERARITAMQATPSTWRMLFDAGWSASAGFKALVGGEALARDLADALLGCCAEVWNMYGPTEATVWSSCWQVRAGVPVAIGTPLANERIWVLDELGALSPIGVPGEIVIAGAGVALGYWQRPELNADRFVPDRFGARPGELMYRTGDRGRWRNDGQLEHLGRLDFQVKLRGYRIELGEIEARLAEHPRVAQALAVVREDVAGDARLVAYVVPSQPTQDGDAQAWVGELRRHLGERLPAYMIPQHFVELQRMPLLPNGKVDRKALPSPMDVSSVQRPASASAGPLSETEAVVVRAMEQALQLPGVGPEEDFFSLGGHSLLAARLIARLNGEFDLRLPLQVVFDAPTATLLAGAIESARSQGVTQVPLRHDPARRSAPLTAQQERIAFMQELHPDRGTYNAPSAHRLEGPLDPQTLLEAVRRMVQRQSVLRTAIRGESGVYEQVVSEDVQVDMPLIDLRGLPEPEKGPELMRQMQRIVDRPMDLQEAPLFRCALFQLDDEVHTFLFVPHHIIWDGWSFDLLYEELAACLSVTSSRGTIAMDAPELRASYLDYACWQQEWMQSGSYSSLLQEWTEHIANSPEVGELPTDVPRGASMSGVGSSEWVRIEGPIVQGMRDVARDAGVTMSMLCLGLYAAMLTLLSRSDSLTIGIPVRGRTFPELEPVMGFFNNLLPLPLGLDRARSVVDFLGDVKGELVRSLRFQEIPFERLAAQPSMLKRARRAGLYQALFSFQDVRDRERQWGPLRQKNVLILQKGATEDLGLWLMDGSGALEGGLNYNADVYKPATVQAMRDLYLEMVQRFVAEPGMPMGSLLDEQAYAAMPRLHHLQSRATPPEPALQEAPSTGRPLSETERKLAGVWAEMLGIGVQQIRPEDNFFDLGGDSLRAMEVIARMQRETGKRANPRNLVFESLAQMAGSYDLLEASPKGETKASTGFLKRLLGGGR